MQESNASWSYGNKEYLPECENSSENSNSGRHLEIWKNKTIEYFNAHKKEYDIIMTRSMPPESHEIGLENKKKLNRKLSGLHRLEIQSQIILLY